MVQEQIFLRLSFLPLEMTLPFSKLWYAFEQKFFSPTIILRKSYHSQLSENEPKNIPSSKITYL